MSGQNPIGVVPVNPSVIPVPNVGLTQTGMLRVGINGPFVFSPNGSLVASSLSGASVTALITG